MSSQTEHYEKLARLLLNAQHAKQEVDPITRDYPDLTLTDAYRIQKILVRLSESPLAGLKAALTSKAKQQAMNVDQPGYGILLESMLCDGILYSDELIHPRVEPEIALFFDGFIQAGIVTAADVAGYATGLATALEVIDSRYRKFRFSAVDVYADNCSSARYMVSHEQFSPGISGLENFGVVLEKNGEVLQTGTPAAVLGSPYISAAFILNLAFEHGVELPESFVVLTGGITDAVPVMKSDSVRAVFGGIGEISLSVE